MPWEEGFPEWARSAPRAVRSNTHPKKSAWSAVPYREGDSSSSGYSVSLVLSVPRPMAAITKSTGRMTWAMKPRTSRRVWWDLLMNRAEVLFSSRGKPCRLLDLIRSWSGHKGRHLVTGQHLCTAGKHSGMTFRFLHTFTEGKSKLRRWNKHRIRRGTGLQT